MDLWPHLSDTTALNERLGLPEMYFEERDGRLHGVSGKGGFRQEWIETPWEWESERGLLAERIYSKGFARVVRVRFLLADAEGGGTRLAVYVGWIPRGWWSRPLLRWANRWMRKQYDRVLRELDDEIERRIEDGVRESERASRENLTGGKTGVDENRLRTSLLELESTDVPKADAVRLVEHIRDGSDQDLFRIRPKALVVEWEIELRSVLTLLLEATRVGLLRLSWDVLCPHCRGVRSEVRSLGEIREFDRCDVCDLDFSATGLDSIEVSFRVHPEVRMVREIFFCSAEPAKKPHIRIQRSLDPGESYQTRCALSPGRYRLRGGPGRAADLKPCLFTVVDEGTGSGDGAVEFDLGGDGFSKDRGAIAIEVSGDASLLLKNSGPVTGTAILEEVVVDSLALRPPELFNLQKFRDLFSEESIASGMNIEVGHQSLLFTDVVGSSGLYAELGDAEAFRLMRDHFVELQRIIADCGGAAVKTIGDAMMASFSRPEDVLEAGVKIQERFRPGGEERLDLRVAIHRGVCLAVRLESNIDYFGNAVNFAAKMQGSAGAGEIVFSDEFFCLPGMRERFEAMGLRWEKARMTFFAEAGGCEVYLASLLLGS